MSQEIIAERVRAGMRARLEGWHIGRPVLALDRESIVRDRRDRDNLGTIARNHGISRTTVYLVLNEHASPSAEQVA